MKYPSIHRTAPYRPVTYPGYKGGNGYHEHLASVSLDPRFRRGSHQEIIDHDRGSLVIERHVSWDRNYRLRPMEYSMAITRRYGRIGLASEITRAPSGERLLEIAQHMGKFIDMDEITGHDHNNAVANARVTSQADNLQVRRFSPYQKQVTIDISQYARTDSIEAVTQGILPRAMEYYQHFTDGLPFGDENIMWAIHTAESNAHNPHLLPISRL